MLDAIPGKKRAVCFLSRIWNIEAKVMQMHIMDKLAAHPQPVPLEANGLVAGVEVLVRVPYRSVTKNAVGSQPNAGI